MTKKLNEQAPMNKGYIYACLVLVLAGGAIGLLYVLPTLLDATAVARASADFDRVHYLAHCLGDYAADHHGNYPEGKSSTEVFQKLLDEHYIDISDGRFFYTPMPGKTMAQTNQLKPENVCWDVTYCVGFRPPDSTPLVFKTGYRIRYVANADALPLKKYPSLQKWLVRRDIRDYLPYSTVDGSGSFPHSISDGSIPDFIPADFDPKGKVYRQLTPDGELTP